jgi:GNAT superfamily N-acetyltransferase
MTIREAELSDLAKLEAGAREFYAASKFLKGFDADRFNALWSRLIESGAGVVFVLEKESAPIGAIGGVIYPDTYSADQIATEFFWFVREGHRGQGLRLYEAFEDWARRRGCQRIRMAHLCDLMPDGLKWLYGELGFHAVEISYEKELPQCA